MATPDGIKYTPEHEWVLGTDGTTVRIGITDYAQQQLGDVVFVQLPDLDQQVEAGSAMGEVESTKSVSDLYAPVGGRVVARNERLDEQPDLVNTDPLGEGWMIELAVDDPAAVAGLLTPEAYQDLIDQA
ncbi:glycine cleavage system protein GcvH [Saccharopolyspora sp. CA-218241]|uniref:glycine cleavage system protein GcvH n=1 Tax=Saccharopolyspora sp. CA-218241 TaxID=3240027 RepID=UPI003D99EE2B